MRPSISDYPCNSVLNEECVNVGSKPGRVPGLTHKLSVEGTPEHLNEWFHHGMRDRPPQDSQPDLILALLVGAISGGLGTGAYHIYSGVREARVDTFTGTVETDLTLGTGLGAALVGAYLLARHLAGRRR
jgi:hypothetical protein